MVCGQIVGVADIDALSNCVGDVHGCSVGVDHAGLVCRILFLCRSSDEWLVMVSWVVDVSDLSKFPSIGTGMTEK